MRAIGRRKLEFYPREQYDKDGYFYADSLGLLPLPIITNW